MTNARDCVWPLVEQMHRAEEGGLHFLALMAALTLPDIAAALSDEKGKTSASKYRAWIEHWLSYDEPSAYRLYKFRCAFLHEGSFAPDSETRGPLARVIFVEPRPGQAEMHGPEATLFDTSTGTGYMPLSVDAFIGEVTDAVERWLVAHGQSHRVSRNAERLVRRYPEGLGPFRVPVIA